MRPESKDCGVGTWRAPSAVRVRTQGRLFHLVEESKDCGVGTHASIEHGACPDARRAAEHGERLVVLVLTAKFGCESGGMGNVNLGAWVARRSGKCIGVPGQATKTRRSDQEGQEAATTGGC
ncbi:hypothetical protein MA16_Dca026958 [Dendrobium catenatum]|uniref:Uncharacterized protein n=1 Tax=Dendrobium catenatum TaxID=906689 RepID=A0A2I0WYK3_9ASPA|nr:hypothetical protein MA16_Dca026958 [Dendrobium catenatum]